MEGSSMQRFPRTELDKPVELQIGKDLIRVDGPANNVGAGGVFVHRDGLAVGDSVHVRIPAEHVFEADGKVYETDTTGASIGFTSVSDGNRQALDDLIEDLTRRGLPAA
jgi:hypothetical protein